jgi:hypothetical protein
MPPPMPVPRVTNKTSDLPRPAPNADSPAAAQVASLSTWMIGRCSRRRSKSPPRTSVPLAALMFGENESIGQAHPDRRSRDAFVFGCGRLGEGLIELGEVIEKSGPAVDSRPALFGDDASVGGDGNAEDLCPADVEADAYHAGDSTRAFKSRMAA